MSIQGLREHMCQKHVGVLWYTKNSYRMVPSQETEDFLAEHPTTPLASLHNGDHHAREWNSHSHTWINDES